MNIITFHTPYVFCFYATSIPMLFTRSVGVLNCAVVSFIFSHVLPTFTFKGMFIVICGCNVVVIYSLTQEASIVIHLPP